MQKLLPDYEGKPVSFISINAKNPKGQVDAEVKRFRKKYKMTYPVYYGKGQDINRDFQVLKLPRLILVTDGKVRKDIIFLKASDLKVEIDKLLAEVVTDEIEGAPSK
ncbi:redoxin domain-containing protein [bacterium]|nr:redoxin domain-containing protein [bacterium]